MTSNFIYNSSIAIKKKKIFTSLVFIILSFVFIFCIFEGYFRYKFDESDSLGFLNVTDRWYQRHVIYNNFQYRDRNFNLEKTSGVVRIGVMGDSNAFGYGIKNIENRFSNILEKKLKDTGYNVEVYNFGVPGTDTWNEIEEYNKNIKQLNPDILIWQYFLNDAEPPKSAGSKVLNDTGNSVPPIVSLISKHSFFFDYLYWRLSAKYVTTFTALKNADIEQYSIPSVFSDHKKRIENFTQELEQENIKTVVIVFPFMRFFPNYPATEIHTLMDKLFKDDGVTAVVDLLPYLKGKNAKDLVVNRYDTHPNEYVHRLAADKLYNVVTLLLQNSPTGTQVKN